MRQISNSFSCADRAKGKKGSISFLEADTQVCQLGARGVGVTVLKNKMFSFLLSTFGLIAANKVSEDKSTG